MKNLYTIILLLFIGVNYTEAQVVTTLAGSSLNFGTIDGTGAAAKFHYPSGLDVDDDGNIYVADYSNRVIRKITPSGVVTTLAGGGAGSTTNGTGTVASFSTFFDLAVSSNGTIYVADTWNNRVRKITSSGVVSNFAGTGAAGSTDGPGTSATFSQIGGITIDASGTLYVTDEATNRIRKIKPNGTVSTLAGSGVSGSADGVGTNASFSHPSGICVDPLGDNIFVSDYSGHKIRKITKNGVVTTIAGSTYGNSDGTGTGAKFAYPRHIEMDYHGTLYVTDEGNNSIRKIETNGVVTRIIGNLSPGDADGTGTNATLFLPGGVCIDNSGNMYISNRYAHTIKKVVDLIPPAPTMNVFFRSSNYDGYGISGPGQSDGSFETLVLGGVAPYSYRWTGAKKSSKANPNGMVEGVYFLEVTDYIGQTTKIGPINLVAKP